MKSTLGITALVATLLGQPALAATLVNGLELPGNLSDFSGLGAGPNQSRVGFFSDIYYDSNLKEWWALSDRGPGGGVIDYQTRMQRFTLDVNPLTGAISNFQIAQTILFTRNGAAFNGLRPDLLPGGNVSTLGNSFDPEGLVVNPVTGHFYVSDEYGPSLYEFNRSGEFVRAFNQPANLTPKLADATTVDYSSGRGANGVFFGRQDNRGYEGLTISPDGQKLYAVLQDPLMNEPGPNNGRDGRNVRIVGFDLNGPNAGNSSTQLVYQLEPQADVAARINAAQPGGATATDPRQGRNIGISAITAIDQDTLLVLERDNRGLGVDDPTGSRAAGSKRVYAIEIGAATDASGVILPGADPLPAGVTAVSKSATPYIDVLTALGGNAAGGTRPSQGIPEKLEGLSIGPQLADGTYLILMGTDNDYSVTQESTVPGCVSVQCDVFVNGSGDVQYLPLGSAAPDGYKLIPGFLYAFKSNAGDLVSINYTAPIPEPGTYAMLCAGMLGLILITSAKRRRG